MTNFEYILENMTVRDLAKAMDPMGSGFTHDHIIGRAWYAWNKHCSMMEGYQKNHGNVYSSDKPVNPFSWSRYAIYVDGVREAVEGHSEIVSYDTWLCKQYNPEEWN
jgi:hypothetical protein